MRLTNIRAITTSGQPEIVVELDGTLYQSTVFPIGQDAQATAHGLRQLAARIEHCAIGQTKQNEAQG